MSSKPRQTPCALGAAPTLDDHLERVKREEAAALAARAHWCRKEDWSTTEAALHLLGFSEALLSALAGREAGAQAGAALQRSVPETAVAAWSALRLRTECAAGDARWSPLRWVAWLDAQHDLTDDVRDWLDPSVPEWALAATVEDVIEGRDGERTESDPVQTEGDPVEEIAFNRTKLLRAMAGMAQYIYTQAVPTDTLQEDLKQPDKVAAALLGDHRPRKRQGGAKPKGVLEDTEIDMKPGTFSKLYKAGAAIR